MEGICFSVIERSQTVLIVGLSFAIVVVMVTHHKDEFAHGILEGFRIAKHRNQLLILVGVSILSKVTHHSQCIKAAIRTDVLQCLGHLHHRAFCHFVAEVDVRDDAKRETSLFLCPSAQSCRTHQCRQEKSDFFVHKMFVVI